MKAEYILGKFNKPVPRYTSYPTAPHFADGLGKEIIREILSGTKSGERISLYIHIPYCDRLCWFCGCHTKQTRKYAPVAKYVDTLVKEIELHQAHFSGQPVLGHLHFGGGSPSMLHSEDFARISLALRKTFHFDRATEISVEIDPNDHTEDLLKGLKIIGATRASIGVQDFDPAVQKAINRLQTSEQTHDLVRALRDIGIQSLNIDALYGLPLQDMPALRSTISKILAMEPDRVAMFGYAHVPWIKKHQNMIREEDLPGSLERFEQAQTADVMLREAGLCKIGIDHYARSEDELAMAAANGTLRRNFQGYTTDSCETMIGMGASSIGRSQSGYVQNLVPTGQYVTSINSGVLAAAKGCYLSLDDRIRADIIEQLMCGFKFSYQTLVEKFGEDARPYIDEARLIAQTEEDGLCKSEEGCFLIPEEARPFARIVVSRFDAYLQNTGFKYSKAV